MRKEVSQGFGLLAIAAVCGLIGAVTGEEGQVALLGAFLFGIGGLVLVAYGLLRGQNGQRPAE